jgi:hypothetical protein
MTRTGNTLRVTFSANIDFGEGYLTTKSYDTLSNIPASYGWMWAMDVVGDWQSEIDRVLDYAKAQHVGWMDATSPNNEPAADCREAALRLWEGGVWPDSFTLTDYEIGAELDSDFPYGLDPDSEFDEYVCGDDFFELINKRAKVFADEAIAEMRENGVSYPHGNNPSISDLTMFYVLKGLVGKGDKPARVP